MVKELLERFVEDISEEMLLEETSAYGTSTWFKAFSQVESTANLSVSTSVGLPSSLSYIIGVLGM